MSRTDIGWVGLAASLALVIVALAISRWQRLRLERELIIACVRGLGQLLIVGFALTLVIADDAPIAWSWLWAAGIVVAAAQTVRRRATSIPGVFASAVTGLGLALATSFAIAFGMGIFPADAQVIVPVTGMIVGNSMKASVVAATRLGEEVSDKRMELEARLALGWSGQRAIRPALRSALRLGLTPIIENVRGLGIIFLPGAMTGLILAGVDPADAVLVQLAIMFLILGSAALASVTIGLMSSRHLFTDDLRPIVLARSSRDEG